MNYHLDYRPAEIKQVVGNSSLKEILSNMLEVISDFPHTTLFHGPTGCGKTTFARIIAKELGGAKEDIVELDSAQFRGIDTVRDIRRDCQYSPLGGTVRIYIIDEVHKMTNDAQHAFLKILEDTPSHVYFILCTTEPQKLLPTIKGRCSQFQVSLLTDLEMKKLLKRIVKKENEKLTSQVYEQIIQDAQGHPRNALQVLQQVLSVPTQKRLETAKQTAEEESQAIDLCRKLMDNRTKDWKTIANILKGLKGQEVEGIRRIVLGYASSTLLNTEATRAALVLEAFIDPFYDSGFPQLVYACYTVIKG